MEAQAEVTVDAAWSEEAACTCRNSQGHRVPGSLFVACETLAEKNLEEEASGGRGDGDGDGDGDDQGGLLSMSHGQRRGYVFPGERVKVLCTIEEDVTDEELEDLEKKNCYWLGLTRFEEEEEEERRGEGAAMCVDTLDASSVSREVEESMVSPVAGLARALCKCWKEEGRAVICLEASVPREFPASGCSVLLDVKQYLRYPLGGTDAEDLYEHFLCRRWTRKVEVFNPVEVKSFVAGGQASRGGETSGDVFVSVTVANVLPPRIDCVLSMQNFQVLSDPMEAVKISQVYPNKVGKSHAEVSPGTEYSFAIRTEWDDRGSEGSKEPKVAVDLLLSVSTSVSSSPLLYVHRLDWVETRSPGRPDHADRSQAAQGVLLQSKT
ncbi:hypothetical protein HOP50_09g57020 [Chloropicon primus]|uniref:Uncharacterized protein n=1 Tax=Chloropicon primus TaxID=1764295 RepID=A0A5B8MRT1_9CHLO|nr:hypothetical protein A3770_09p56810 [Chloropicon primus]UPR02376.1 hypothetical protein HOP50_09g57020 [Chloropicon primus]|eukprot:QDZ23163.1 hypothetical protein A3770_09p56810 [Chloropicon primus]